MKKKKPFSYNKYLPTEYKNPDTILHTYIHTYTYIYTYIHTYTYIHVLLAYIPTI